MSDPYAPYPPPAPPYGGPQIPPQYAPPTAGAIPTYPVSFEPAAPDEPYAHWGLRVLASLIDTALMIPFVVAIVIGNLMVGDTSEVFKDEFGNITAVKADAWTWTGLGVVLVSYIALLVFMIWNTIVRQGRRGASIGKACLNLMVVSEADGHPIGALMTFVRQIVHLVDGLPLYLGYLWPLWDSKRQTFADMIMHTAVLHLPPEPPGARETGVKAW